MSDLCLYNSKFSLASNLNFNCLTKVNLENIQIMGNQCLSYTYLNVYNLSSVTTFTSTINNCGINTFKAEHSVKLGSLENIPASFFKRSSYTEYNLLKSVDLSGVKTINGSSNTSAFYNCKGLTSITGTEDLETLPADTFSGCVSLETISEMPKLKQINSSTFKECTKLKSISIPNVTNISTYAFTNCTSLKDINMGGVIAFGGSTFKGCTSLEVADCYNATALGYDTFKGCTNLISVEINENEKNITQGTFLVDAPKILVVYTNCAKAIAYDWTADTQAFTITIPNRIILAETDINIPITTSKMNLLPNTEVKVTIPTIVNGKGLELVREGDSEYKLYTPINLRENLISNDTVVAKFTDSVAPLENKITSNLTIKGLNKDSDEVKSGIYNANLQFKVKLITN